MVVEEDWQERFLTCGILLGVLVLGLTELLSACDLLTPGGVRLSWAVLVLLGSAWRGRKSRTPSRGFRPQTLDAESCLWMGALLMLGSLTLVAALVAPPNNSDSLVYHMTRVANWIQNGSVAHYPVPDTRHLYFPPGAEFAILQLQLLWGNDRLANLVQWFSAVGCCVGIAAITHALGGGARTQLYAAVVCASLPMLTLQASSTQNDAVESFWLVCLAYFSIRVKNRFRWRWWWLASASVGLAWITKGTGYVLSLPFLAVLLCHRPSLRKTLVLALTVLLINGCFYVRNLRLCGNPLALNSPGTSDTRMTSPTPLLWSWNVGRNLAVHLPLEQGSLVERGLWKLQLLSGVDPDDRRFTFPYGHFTLSGGRWHEDLVGNYLDLPLVLCALLGLVLGWGRDSSTQALDPRGGLTPYTAQIVVAFLLCCGALRWQPWIVRLQLPIWVLLSPLVAWALLSLRRPRWSRYLLLAHLGLGFLCILFNETRPWIDDRVWRSQGHAWNIFTLSRQDQYFSSTPPDFQLEYRQAWTHIRALHPPVLGLLGSGLDYLLWAQAREDCPTMKFAYVGVTNESFQCLAPPPPELILRSWTKDPLTVAGQHYQKIWESKRLQLYTRTRPDHLIDSEGLSRG